MQKNTVIMKKVVLLLRKKRSITLYYLAKKFIKDVIYNYDMLSSDKSNEDDFLARQVFYLF